MSNLGWYKIIVEMAKKVGGPKTLLGITFGIGAAVGAAGACGGLSIKNKTKKKLAEIREAEEKAVVFEVKKEATSKNGLHFNKGDHFKVLELIEEIALIELLGRDDNPFIVEQDFLTEVSDYRRMRK